MRVIARSTLANFVKNRVERQSQALVQGHLNAWYAEVARASWKSPAELKEQYRSASILPAGRVVFNIQGNRYRLVVSINYQFSALLILWLGTHKEYDEIDVTKVEYDKRRYADPSHSN